MSEPIVSVERATAHLRLDDPASDEDFVKELLLVAEEAISEYLQRPLTPWSTTQLLPPKAVQHAVLLHVGSLYAFREADVERTLSVNPTLDRLLFPHRLGLGV